MSGRDEILTADPRHVILHFDWWNLCVCICLRL